MAPSRSPAAAVDGRPLSIQELADLATVQFDPAQPLRRYIGAVRQLISESKVYCREGDYDLAFVISIKVLHLTTDLLPNRHPEWEHLPSSAKAQIRRDSEQISGQLSDLRKAIYKRNEAWEKAHPTASAYALAATPTPAPTAASISTASPALTLRNTVQPSTMSMTSAPSHDVVHPAVQPPKEGRAMKLRKKLGLGKKVAPPPVVGETESWTVLERAEVVAQGRDVGRRREMVVEREMGKLPLPGEEDHEEVEGGIAYDGSSSYPIEPTWSPHVSVHALDRPPALASLNSQHSAHSPSTAPSAPLHPAPQSRPAFLTPAYCSGPSYPTAPPPSQSYAEPSQSYSALPPPHSYAAPPIQPSSRPAALQRTPSRLTASHQQQQGYAPSPSAQTPTYPSHLPRAPSLPPYASPLQPRYLLPSLYSSAPPFPHSHPPSRIYPLPPPPTYPTHPRPTPSAPPPKLVRSGSLASLPLGLIEPRWALRETKREGEALEIAEVAEVVEEYVYGRTEGGQPLRNVVISTELVSAFVALAMENTDRGVETCGLLMGTLSHNTFRITHLLVPKQEGTSDMCTTTHEEEQFAFQDERDLMTLGWIHTHPTQSCFMSSLDLHTHASYQVMLAEAIAIVCAPTSEPSFGIFRLTDPPGLEAIVKCDIKGLFHPHPELPIYTDCDHGHVQLRAKQKFEAVDLRRRV